MIFADTGFFIAILNPRDELHSRALGWLPVVKAPLVVSEYVIWETINYFSMPIDRPKVHAWLAQVRSGASFEVVAASPALFDAAVQLHRQRPDQQWSLTDCASFVIMQDKGIREALAWDHHFEQAGYLALLRLERPSIS